MLPAWALAHGAGQQIWCDDAAMHIAHAIYANLLHPASGQVCPTAGLRIITHEAWFRGIFEKRLYTFAPTAPWAPAICDVRNKHRSIP